MRYLLIFTIVLYISLAVYAVILAGRSDKKKYTKFKCIASLMFLAISFISFLITKNSIYFGLIPAYIFCFFGDLFLGIYQIYDKKKSYQFKLGLMSFFLAHIFYVIKFVKLIGKYNFLDLILPVLMVTFTILKTKNKKLRLGHGLLPLCLTYVFMVSLTAATGIELGIRFKMPIIVIGVLCFLVSDSIIAFKYFGAEKKKWYSRVELTLYYISMLILSMIPILLA